MDGLLEAVAAACGVWEGAVPATRVVAGAVAGLSDDDLVELLRVVGAHARRVDGVKAVVAAQVAARSPREDGGGLARRRGFASPGTLVAGETGEPTGRAVSLIQAGTAVGDGSGPVAYPRLAAGLTSGVLDPGRVALIAGMLDRVAPVADEARLAAAEAELAEVAGRVSWEVLRGKVRVAEASLNPGGLDGGEAAAYERRFFSWGTDRDGNLRLKGFLDPATGAPVAHALEEFATAAMRAGRGKNHPESDTPGDVGMVEKRSVGQLGPDGLATFARHVLGCREVVPGLPPTTLVVRVDLGDLVSGLAGRGYATVDGSGVPLSAGAARALASSAGLLPAVLGGASVPLDLGRTSRAFSRAQVLALWERDGGCAFCGQARFVEAHHIKWWLRDAGVTDLSNGLLLCSRCHHDIHSRGWGIVVHAGNVWFIPPAVIDKGRVPRPAVNTPPGAPTPHFADLEKEPSWAARLRDALQVTASDDDAPLTGSLTTSGAKTGKPNPGKPNPGRLSSGYVALGTGTGTATTGKPSGGKLTAGPVTGGTLAGDVRRPGGVTSSGDSRVGGGWSSTVGGGGARENTTGTVPGGAPAQLPVAKWFQEWEAAAGPPPEWALPQPNHNALPGDPAGFHASPGDPAGVHAPPGDRAAGGHAPPGDGTAAEHTGGSGDHGPPGKEPRGTPPKPPRLF